MARFQGFLIKNSKTGKVFPDKYMAYGSYDTTPNIREEIKAYRNENTRNLTRVTAEGHKTTIKFKTRKNLYLKEIQEVQNFFTSGETDALQRKIRLQYWNKEDNAYKTSNFYRPDINFKVIQTYDHDIKFDELEIELVEY